jgi:hypothetical protein
MPGEAPAHSKMNLNILTENAREKKRVSGMRSGTIEVWGRTFRVGRG